MRRLRGLAWMVRRVGVVGAVRYERLRRGHAQVDWRWLYPPERAAVIAQAMREGWSADRLERALRDGGL